MSLLYSGRPRGQTSRAMPPAVGMHARGTRALVCTQWRAQLDILPEMIIDQKSSLVCLCLRTRADDLAPLRVLPRVLQAFHGRRPARGTPQVVRRLHRPRLGVSRARAALRWLGERETWHGKFQNAKRPCRDFGMHSRLRLAARAERIIVWPPNQRGLKRSCTH